MAARSLWYLTWSSLDACSNRSSPLTLIRLHSLRTSRSSLPRTTFDRFAVIGGRCKKVWKSFVQPGAVRSTISCTLSAGFSPRTHPNCPNNHATTGTLQELPSRVIRRSTCSWLPCLALPMHCTVKPRGKPRITSRSSTFGRRNCPSLLVRQCWGQYWYGGYRKASAAQRCKTSGEHCFNPAGL